MPDLDPDIVAIAAAFKKTRKRKIDYANALNIRSNGVSDMLAGRRRLQKKEVAITERFFEIVLPSTLERDSTSFLEASNIKLAPVRGETAAGVWLEIEDFDEARFSPVPFVPDRYPNREQFAFKVNGASVDLERIFDGDYVVCVEDDPVPGDVVVIERRNGALLERACKVLVARDDGKRELVSHSSDERFNRDPIPLGDGHDETEVVIVGLVIGSYRPRTSRSSSSPSLRKAATHT